MGAGGVTWEAEDLGENKGKLHDYFLILFEIWENLKRTYILYNTDHICKIVFHELIVS